MRRRLLPMLSAQIETYRNVHKMTLTGRELEAAVLAKAAQKLTLCQDNWEASDREKNLQGGFKIQPAGLDRFSNGVVQSGKSSAEKAEGRPIVLERFYR